MATDAQIRTRQKYLGRFDDIKIRVEKGRRDVYKELAESQGKSLNALIIELLEKELKGAP